MRLVFIAALTLATVPVAAGTLPGSQRADPPGSSPSIISPNVQSYDCNSLWDPMTHMSKLEWARSCDRVQGRLQEIQTIEDRAPRLPKE